MSDDIARTLPTGLVLPERWPNDGVRLWVMALAGEGLLDGTGSCPSIYAAERRVGLSDGLGGRYLRGRRPGGVQRGRIYEEWGVDPAAWDRDTDEAVVATLAQLREAAA